MNKDKTYIWKVHPCGHVGTSWVSEDNVIKVMGTKNKWTRACLCDQCRCKICLNKQEN